MTDYGCAMKVTLFKSIIAGNTCLAIALMSAGSGVHAEEGKAIFNGKDLSGWYGLNPHQLVKVAEDKKKAALEAYQKEFKEHWSVDNGELVNDGHGPYATTDKEYGDIELELDYKTVALADSGIYLRGAPQVQIWDTTKAGGKWDRKANLGSGSLFNNSDGTPSSSSGNFLYQLRTFLKKIIPAFLFPNLYVQ